MLMWTYRLFFPTSRAFVHAPPDYTLDSNINGTDNNIYKRWKYESNKEDEETLQRFYNRINLDEKRCKEYWMIQKKKTMSIHHERFSVPNPSCGLLSTACNITRPTEGRYGSIKVKSEMIFPWTAVTLDSNGKGYCHNAVDSGVTEYGYALWDPVGRLLRGTEIYSTAFNGTTEGAYTNIDCKIKICWF